jgi:homocysteine S-methyltransferase
LESYKTAEFLHYEVPGYSIPAPILERMAHAANPDAARAEGIRIAQETLERVQGMVQGVQIRGPFEGYETAIEVLSALSAKGVSQ